MNKLLQTIYNHPADDSARLVYADWLQQRGDPRGEFIVLQYTDSRRARRAARGLQRRHGWKWLGALAEYTMAPSGRKAHFDFDRGFPSMLRMRGEVDLDDDKLEDAHRLPEWSTVDEISLSADQLRHLARHPMSAGVIQVVSGHAGRMLADALGEADMPHLRELDLQGMPIAFEEACVLITVELVHRLKVLGLKLDSLRLVSGVYRLVADELTSIERFTITGRHGWTISFEGETFSEVTVTVTHPFSRPHIEALSRAVAETMPRHVRVKGMSRSGMRRLMERQILDASSTTQQVEFD